MKDKMEKVLTHIESFLSDSEDSMFGSKTPQELRVIVLANLASVKSTG